MFRRWSVALFILLVSPVMVSSAPLAPHFRSSYLVVSQQTTASSPHPFALADMNRDGAIDLVAIGGQDYVPMTIRFGDGYGNFGPAVRPEGTESMRAFLGSVYVADLNLDHCPDLIFGTRNAPYDTAQRIDVLLGHGDGTFDLPIVTRTSKRVSAMAIGDMNEDGIPDLIGGSIGFVVLMGDGTGHFVESHSQQGLISQFDLVDMDGDGHLDILCGTGVQYGDGSGSISGEKSFSSYAGSVHALIDIDLDHDGATDVLTGTSDYSGQLAVHFNSPNGSFFSTRDTRYFVDCGANSIALADFDRDGVTEIIHTGCEVTIESVTPDGRLQHRWSLPSPSANSRPLYAEVADLDRDGWLDLVVAGDEYTAVYFFGPSGPPEPAPSIQFPAATGPVVVGDFAADGRRRVAVLLGADSMAVVGATRDGILTVDSRFAVAHGSSSPIVTDVDGDGRDDLVLVNAPSHALSVFRSLPGNTWARTDVPSVATPWVAAGDVDRDGYIDLVTANGNVYLYLGTGSGFADPQPAGDITANSAGCLLDVDGDGLLDLVQSSGGYSASTSVYRGVSDGTFAWTQPPNGGGGYELSTTDFNRDGRADLFASGAGSVWAMLNTGGFTLQGRLNAGTSSTGGGTGDVDGDGWPDVVAAMGGWATRNSRRVITYRNDKMGSFEEEPWQYGFGGDNLDRAILVDLTGDGLADLVATEPTSGRLWLAPHVPAIPTGVADLPGSSATRGAFLGSAPNPTRGAAVLRFARPAPGQVRLSIVDVRGRVVRRFPDRMAGEDPMCVAWDGHDDAGSRVGPGIYLARLTQSGGATATGKVVVLP